MNSKKIMSSLLAAAMTMSFAAAFSAPAMAVVDSTTPKGVVSMPGATGTAMTAAAAAAGNYVVSGDTSEPDIYVANSTPITINNGSISLDAINPNQTIYIRLGADTDGVTSLTDNGTTVSPRDLGDKDLFKLDIDKDGDGKNLIKSIEQVSNKSYVTGGARGTYLKVVLADSTTTTDLKANATVTFKARKDHNARGVSAQGKFMNGDKLVLDLNIWINNTKATDDAETGDRVYFDPTKNDTNVIIWGDDRASLKFDADSDTNKFYGRLSTKNDSAIYAQYGDPVNADLWFYDFVSNPSVPSTSRATLTLGIPWEDDDAYVPDPEACFIYQNVDGVLTDVTSLFSYSEDAEEIPGWSIRTRQLGTYILADSELDIAEIDDEDILTDDEPTVTDPIVDGDKVIPDTGASDMVNVAVAAAIVSLAAAGAVAFKKASK